MKKNRLDKKIEKVRKEARTIRDWKWQFAKRNPDFLKDLKKIESLKKNDVKEKNTLYPKFIKKWGLHPFELLCTTSASLGHIGLKFSL